MVNVIKNFLVIALSICAFVMLNSCASHKPSLNANEWTYQPNAIQVNVVADKKLNVANGQSHTLMLAVVQTTSLTKVQHFLQNSQGISTFLGKQNSAENAESFFINRYYISPGETATLGVTRMAGMKFVVLIAAYNHLIPDQTVNIFNIPIDSHVDGLEVWKRIYYPAPLVVNLHLGTQGVLKAYSIR